MNSIEAAITKEINDICSLPCYGATNATEEEQQRGRLAGLTWALNLVVQTQSKSGRADFWRCQACGCLWRDNHDGTVSLGGPTQKSCVKCEYDTPRECEPLYRALTSGTSSGSAGQEASRPANDPIRAAVNAAWGLYSETFVLAIREQLVTDLCAHHPNSVHTFEYICHECQAQDIDDMRVEVSFHLREAQQLTKQLKQEAGFIQRLLLTQDEIERIAARIAKGAASGEKSEGQIEFEILELVKGSAPVGSPPPPSGVDLIAVERQRQVTVEGWTPDHDDSHDDSQLSSAARAYIKQSWHDQPLKRPPAEWPWETAWWKPAETPMRNLVKAGALIAAEIDRLQRLEVEDASAPRGGGETRPSLEDQESETRVDGERLSGGQDLPQRATGDSPTPAPEKKYGCAPGCTYSHHGFHVAECATGKPKRL